MKRVKKWFNRPASAERVKGTKQKKVSEYLHVDGVDQVKRQSKSLGRREPGRVSSSTAEWYVSNVIKSEDESDAIGGDVMPVEDNGIRKGNIDYFKTIDRVDTEDLIDANRSLSNGKYKTKAKPPRNKANTYTKIGFEPSERRSKLTNTVTKNKTKFENDSSNNSIQKQQSTGSVNDKRAHAKYSAEELEQIIVAHETTTDALKEETLRQIHNNVKEQYMNMDIQEKRQLYKCGENFLINEQIPNWAESSRKRTDDLIIPSEKSSYQPNETLNQKVALWYGDITRLELDVVVNSTSSSDDAVGVNKAIHEAAGIALDLDLKAQGQLVTGSVFNVFKTRGYNLPAKWIYHVSGPFKFWENARVLLSQCYVNVLNLMKEEKLRTIAFPCMWAGSRGLPFNFTAQVALETVRDWLEANHEYIDKIIFCVFEKTTWQFYDRNMHLIFPAAESMSETVKSSTLPAEILRMDNKSVELYKKALEQGKERDYSIRIMVTGPYGVGKSTFTKRLLCQDVNINERNSTDGIDVHVKKCKVSLETSHWILDHAGAKEDNTIQRLTKVLKGTSEKDKADTFGLNESNTGSEGNHDSENKLDGTVNDIDGERFQDPGEVPDENSGSISEDFDYVDGVQESDEANRLKHEDILMRDLKEVILDAGKGSETEDHADVSVWDFGGQFVFYSTHQMFLSHRAIYILINNMNQHIGDVVVDDEPYFDCSGTKSLKIEDFLDLWLNSIHGHSKSERQGTPPVILVGTHADKLNPDTRDEQTEAVFDAIRNRFVGKDVSLHFIDKDFGLSNATVDAKLDDLRQTIMDVAKQQPYWGEVKPAKWIPLEKLLEELRRKGVEILSHSEIEQLNQNLPVPITGDEELELFLRFQHETANIMYFSVPELHTKIVLSPQFLVNALKSLITAEMFCKKKPEILDKWMEFRQKGILKTSLLDAVWNREDNRQFRENREHILALMEHLNIVARPILYPDDEETHDDDSGYYLVPCMLKESPPESIFHAERPFISTPCLCLVVENVAFPSAVFNRLLVGCMACWPVAKSGKKYHIYCGCGQFDVDVQHRLTLSFRSNVVALRITRYSQTNRHPSVSICSSVYRTVKQILEKISKYLSLVLTFDECVQCPLSPTDSVACLHSVEKLKSCDEFPCHEHHSVAILHSCDLLRYWYETEDTDYNSNSDGRVKSSVLAPVIASRVPTEKELVKISQGIGLEFQQLFLKLGISDARIGQIRGSNPLSVPDQVIQLLLEWRRQRGCLATFRELESAMNLVGTDTVVAFKDIRE